jgi:hypothetical protein
MDQLKGKTVEFVECPPQKPLQTHRERDFPFDLSDALLALLSLFLFDALLPLRFESRLRERDFSE